MKCSAENTLAQRGAREKPYNTSYVLGMCALFMVLIIGRAVSNLFIFVFMAVGGVVFLLSSPKHCVTMLFFLMPFSTFLKPSPGGMSFFTILFFLTVVKLVLVHRKISLGLLLSAVLFLAFNLFFSGLQGITTVVTMIFGALLLYYLRQEEIDIKTVVLLFTAGICLASVLASLRNNLPLVNAFVREYTLKMGEGDRQDRFAGFVGNPNYYTMSIAMAQAALIVLMNRDEKQWLYITSFVLLSVFGFMSVSKSFLIAWVMLVFFWFILSVRKGIGGVTKFAFVCVLGVAILSFFAYDYLEALAFRLFKDSQGTLSNITTTRSDIWSDYLKAIFADLKILFFGEGVNAILYKKRTHNTYIESVFYFGVVGSVIFLAMLRNGMQKVITAKILWIPVLILLVRMMAIGFVTQDDLWLYLGLIVLLSQHCVPPQVELARINNEKEMLQDEYGADEETPTGTAGVNG